MGISCCRRWLPSTGQAFGSAAVGRTTSRLVETTRSASMERRAAMERRAVPGEPTDRLPAAGPAGGTSVKVPAGADHQVDISPYPRHYSSAPAAGRRCVHKQIGQRAASSSARIRGKGYRHPIFNKAHAANLIRRPGIGRYLRVQPGPPAAPPCHRQRSASTASPHRAHRPVPAARSAFCRFNFKDKAIAAAFERESF